MNTLVGVAALSLPFGVSIQDERPKLPSGPPPVKTEAQWTVEGQIGVREDVLTTGLVDYGLGLVLGTYHVSAITTYDPKEVRAYDHRGRPVDHRSLPRLLKNRVSVLVSSDGRGVDRLILRHVKKGTLILVLPRTKPVPNRPSKTPERLGADFNIYLGGYFR